MVHNRDIEKEDRKMNYKVTDSQIDNMTFNPNSVIVTYKDGSSYQYQDLMGSHYQMLLDVARYNNANQGKMSRCGLYGRVLAYYQGNQIN